MITRRQKQVLDFLRNFRKKQGYAPSLEEICNHLGISSISTAHHHINILEKSGYLKKEENQPRAIDVYEKEQLIQIPLLGIISAGKPIEAVFNKETISVPRSRISSIENIFALRVKGESMIDENIDDGDVVIVKSQPTAENGQRVVALIDNHEVTLKKIYRAEDKIILKPANPKMLPWEVDPEKIVIQGIVTDVIKNITPITEEKISGIKKYQELPLNKIICGDAVEVMKKFPSNSVDIVVTSPPYDEIRDYNGFNYDLHSTGKELFRVLKSGGIVAMVIQDQTKNFGKSLTSFRTIVDWVDNIGFKLFETVIYRKYGAEGAWWNKRFRVDHEYIPVFLKGDRPQHFNKEHLKIPSKHGGKTMTGGGTRLTNGIRIETRSITINPMKCRGTIWEYLTAGDGSRLKHQHPATFPNQLPYDFIQCFCPSGGVVLDPFVGSGTTTVAAKNLGYKYIGIDIAPEYCAIAEKRMESECRTQEQNGLNMQS